MTKDEILAMAPGRELDALVAEKVMGWEATPYNPDYHIQYTDEHGNPYGFQMSDWEPSTYISVAWEVVEKFHDVSVKRFETMKGHRYWCKIDTNYTEEGTFIAQGDTVPEAICKAALLAVLEEIA